MAKMRTMQHNSRANSQGRVHGTKHNDRDFDTDLADNIDASRSDQNVYWNCYEDPELTFTEVELKFYEETFGEQLQQTNEKYIQQSHPERCKTMEEWKMIRRNAPEETTLQIGKMEEHVGHEKLLACFEEYNRRLEAWNAANGKPFTQLTYALHVDEAVPHIQTRRVWHYEDPNGQIRIGQEKALAAAGVQLPNPEKGESRHNNRKMTFDAMTRSMWLDVLHEHGLEVEREALPDGKHNREKEQMIRDKYEEIVQETQQLESEIQPLRELKASVDEVAVETKSLPMGWTAVKTEELATLKEQAKSYVANRDDILDRREREGRIRSKELEVAQKLDYLNKRIRDTNERYAEQLDLNAVLLRERQAHEATKKKLKAATDEIADDKIVMGNAVTMIQDQQAEISSLKAQIDGFPALVEKKVAEATQSLRTQIDGLQSRLRAAYEVVADLITTSALIIYRKAMGYAIDEPTAKQQRLIAGMMEYAAEKARGEGFDDLAKDMETKAGMNHEIRAIIEPEWQKKQPEQQRQQSGRDR